jgi:hypothetical protein
MTDRNLTPLVYELLDALHDTAQLATEIEPEQRWDAHLDYLRDLQRVGREVLAQAEHGNHG